MSRADEWIRKARLVLNQHHLALVVILSLLHVGLAFEHTRDSG